MAEQDVLDKIDDAIDKIDDVIDKINDLKEIMDEPKSIQKICPHCAGDGIKSTSGGDISCPDCNGSGVRRSARITLTSEEN